MRSAAVVLFSLLLLAVRASAAPSLVWDAPAPCATGAQQQRRVEELLGRPLASAAGPVRAVVRISREPGGSFEARIDVTHRDGTRRRVLREADCAVLSSAVAVVVALAIDPHAPLATPPSDPPDSAPSAGPGRASSHHVRDQGRKAGRHGTAAHPAATAAPERDPPRATPAEPPVPPTQSPVRVEEPATPSTEPAPSSETKPAEPASGSPPQHGARDARRTRPLHLRLGGAAALLAGPLPGPVPSGLLSLTLQVGAFDLALRGMYAARAETDPVAGTQARARVGLWSVGLRGAFRLPLGPLVLPLSLGLETGRFDARATAGVSVPGSARPWWMALSAGVGLEWSLPRRVTLGIDLETLVSLRRPRIGVGHAGEQERTTLHRAAPVGLRALFCVSVQLW